MRSLKQKQKLYVQYFQYENVKLYQVVSQRKKKYYLKDPFEVMKSQSTTKDCSSKTFIRKDPKRRRGS